MNFANTTNSTTEPQHLIAMPEDNVEGWWHHKSYKVVTPEKTFTGIQNEILEYCENYDHLFLCPVMF